MCAQWWGRDTSVGKFELAPSCVFIDVKSFPKSFSTAPQWHERRQRRQFVPETNVSYLWRIFSKVHVGDSSNAIIISITRRLVFFVHLSITQKTLKALVDFINSCSSCRFADRVRPSRQGPGRHDQQPGAAIYAKKPRNRVERWTDWRPHEGGEQDRWVLVCDEICGASMHTRREKFFFSKHINCHNLTQFKSHHVVQWFFMTCSSPTLFMTSNIEQSFSNLWDSISTARVMPDWISVWK